MTAAPAIVHDAREQWRMERRELVTASDVAAILGFDPRRSALEVYAQKRGLIEDSESFVMKWGRKVESAIAEAFSEESGRPVFDLGATTILRHPDLPWFGATLDRQTEGATSAPAPPEALAGPARVPAEMKAQGSHRRKEWVADPPFVYRIQLQAQMAVTGATWGSLCALLGGTAIAWVDVLRSDKFINAALPHLEAFHIRVMRGDAPAPRGDGDGQSEGRAVKALFPKDSGLVVALPDDTLTLVKRWEAEAEAEKTATFRKRNLENEIRFRMRDAAVGMLADGTSVQLDTTDVKPYVTKHEARSYRRMRRFIPKGARIR